MDQTNEQIFRDRGLVASLILDDIEQAKAHMGQLQGYIAEREAQLTQVLGFKTEEERQVARSVVAAQASSQPAKEKDNENSDNQKEGGHHEPRQEDSLQGHPV